MEPYYVIADPSCNQKYRQIDDLKFEFSEGRLYNPITKETRIYSATIDLREYSTTEMIEACRTFGYSGEEVKGWILSNQNIALIAECIFELETE